MDVHDGVVQPDMLRAEPPEIEMPGANAPTSPPDEAVLTTTTDYRVTSWDAAAEALHGTPAPAAVGQHLDALVTVDGRPFSESAARLALERDGRWSGSVCSITPGGAPATPWWSMSRRSLPGAGLDLVVVVATDPGGVRRALAALQVSERRTSSALRVAPAGIGLVVNRVIHEVNDELCRMTGYAAHELLGQGARLLYPTEADYQYVGTMKYRQIVEKGTGTVETRWRTKDGAIIDVLLSSTPLDPADLAAGVTFTALDITDRVQAVAELRRSEARYRDLFENANDAILVLDASGRILDANERNREVLGLQRSELIGRSVSTLARFTDLDEATLVRRFADHVADAQPVRNLELECRRADDGRAITVEMSTRVLRAGEDAPGVLVNVRDISERRVAQQALAESEAKFRSIIEASPMGMHRYALEEDGRLVFLGANPAADRILGVDHAAFVGLTLEEAFPSLVPTEIPDRYRAVAARGDTFSTSQVDYRDERVAGAFEVHAFRTAPGRLAALFQDVTARLQAEADLQQKTAEIDGFFSSALDLLCIADTDGHFRRLNPEWERTLGYGLDELVGRPFLDLVHPDDVAATRAKVAELAQQAPVVSFTNRYRHRDGSYRWIEWRSFPAGKIIYAAARDVTERTRIEAALLESERLNRMIAEMASDYVFHLVVAPDGQVRMDYVSRSFTEITGRTLAEVTDVGRWQEFIHPEDLPRLAQQLGRVITERVPVQEECRSYVRGALRWTHLYARPELDPTGQRVVGITGASKDVTEQKRLEREQARLREQLQQAMKMEAIGRLAGGLAHDFNNLLTGILGNVELALLDLGEADPLAEVLKEVSQAAGSAAALTHQLLAFSRKQMIEPRVLDLNDLVSHLERMLTRLIGEDVILRFVPGAELPPVRIDPGQFEQVIVNLAVNARDAMPDGGSLVIETAVVELGASYCDAHPGVTPGRYVRLAVSDTGVGMSPEILSHLFEPFFTTKPKGKGTGLGLATIYGAVKQAGGTVDVYSEPGQGSTFKVYLPAVSGKAERYEGEPRSAELPGGTETVLLVEDEKIVRDLAQRILVRLGYHVLPAASGGEALLLAERHPGRVDLLLTDVVMPGMSGRELATRLASLRPEMKVLYSSGYTENVIVHHGVVDEGLAFLGKPYSAPALARKLREVLGGR